MSERGTYIRAVEAHFLKYRGTGFVLSPKDEALVDGWYDKQIPLQSILRGLDEAVVEMRERENRLQFRPRSISYFARSVEAYSKRTSFAAPSTPKAVDAVVSESKKSLKDTLLHEVRLLEKRLDTQQIEQLNGIKEELRGASEDRLWTILPTLDTDLSQLLKTWLSDEQRETLAEQARDRVSRECGPYLSPKARNEQEAEALAVLCRDHFGFDGLLSVATEVTKS